MKHSILIVEDDGILQEMYSEKFEMEDFEVEKASTGKEGLEKLKKNMPDIILLDILMPDMNGLEMLKEMKKTRDYRDIPVVLLTNLGESKIDMDQELSFALGIKDYLIKTKHTPEDVVKRTKQILKIGV
ncbi:response regulator [candidate division WS5 bacterium]|uniref:Response regulator n=1 Tax=candidate division WS5 bacterium TaxID=2093353 RepID=A0A419DA09_9BACT|nr:MAG: response regulator [candidate division WS5 bacterium]